MKKALVVDDTKNIRTLLTTCLELNGYEALTASNGNEALDLFEKEPFDLAFIDIKMPEISGTEVLRKIRYMGIDIPVVIMTAFATVKNAVECTKLGAVAYLQKPFTADKVKTVLEELRDYDYHEESVKNYLHTTKELINLGKLDEAYSTLKKILSINPSLGECYSLIGKVYELKGNIEEAEKFYNISKQFTKE